MIYDFLFEMVLGAAASKREDKLDQDCCSQCQRADTRQSTAHGDFCRSCHTPLPEADKSRIQRFRAVWAEMAKLPNWRLSVSWSRFSAVYGWVFALLFIPLLILITIYTAMNPTEQSAELLFSALLSIPLAMLVFVLSAAQMGTALRVRSRIKALAERHGGAYSIGQDGLVSWLADWWAGPYRSQWAVTASTFSTQLVVANLPAMAEASPLVHPFHFFPRLRAFVGMRLPARAEQVWSSEVFAGHRARLHELGFKVRVDHAGLIATFGGMDRWFLGVLPSRVERLEEVLLILGQACHELKSACDGSTFKIAPRQNPNVSEVAPTVVRPPKARLVPDFAATVIG